MKALAYVLLALLGGFDALALFWGMVLALCLWLAFMRRP